MLVVLPAEHMGMCFGVKDALNVAHSLDNPEEVSIFGQLVHNPVVNRELERRGFVVQAERSRALPEERPEVMITAHGVSNRQHQALLEAGKQVIDTTCPLVRKAHNMARFWHDRGFFVVLVGKPGHVEVEGLTGDLEHFTVVETADQVARYAAERLVVVAQTTTHPDLFRRMVQVVRERNPHAEVRVSDTICRPTRDRQEALSRLLDRVEALVVVGGRNSNNTRQLTETARLRRVPVIQVEGPEELDTQWLRSFRIVGLTAGTSTPDETISAVHRAILGSVVRLTA